MTCPDCERHRAEYVVLHHKHEYLLRVLEVRGGQIERQQFAIERLERELAEYQPDPELERKNKALIASKTMRRKLNDGKGKS